MLVLMAYHRKPCWYQANKNRINSISMNKFAFWPTISYTQIQNNFLLFLIEITRLQNTLEEYDTQLLLICTILTQIEHLHSKCFFVLPLSSNDLCVGLKTNKCFMLMLVPTYFTWEQYEIFYKNLWNHFFC